MKTMTRLILIFLIIIVALIITWIVVCEPTSKTMRKDELINLFEENVSTFDALKEYILTGEGYFYCTISVNTDDLRIENIEGKLSIGDEKIMRDILFVIESLNFSGIFEDETHIEFMKESGSTVKGIIYLKSDDMPDFVLRSQMIQNKWYYYETENY